LMALRKLCGQEHQLGLEGIDCRLQQFRDAWDHQHFREKRSLKRP
jgi:hypothetical protein